MSDTIRATNIAPSGSSLQILGASNFQSPSGANAFSVGNDSSCIAHGDHWAIGQAGSAGPSGNWGTFGQNWYNSVGYGSNFVSTVNYKSCCISWNGQFVFFTATNTGYGPYFSNNGGRSLAVVSPAANSVGNYLGSAMSASGQYILVANTTTVWLSSNYLPMPLTSTYSYSGYTSVLSVTSTNNSLSMSASGQYCVFAYTASATTGGIYVSSDYGVTWALVSGTNFPWTSVSMSSSGQYITACCNGTPNNIYISSNWGASFALPTTSVSGISNWASVKVSASAQWQVACAAAAVYYSSDYGVTWTAVGANITLPSGTWGAVAISPNGKYMTATNYTSFSNLFINSNYGVGAWTQISGTFELGYHLAMSATGTIAIVSNGGAVLLSALSSTATHSLAPAVSLSSHPSVAANAMLSVNSVSEKGCIYLGTNAAVPATGFFGGAGDKVILYSGTASVYPYSIGISSATLWNSVPSGAQFQWFNNGSAQMTLNSSGYLGIGVAPTAGLHIKNGTSAMRITGTLTNASTRPTLSTAPGTYEIRGSSSGGDGADDGFLRLSAGGGSGTASQSYIDLSGYSTVTDMSSTMIFGTGGTERMRINSSGQVGIGTNPSATLHVNGTFTCNNPIFSIVRTGTFSVSSNSNTVVPYNTSDFDTNGGWNNTSYQYKPTVAGYYQFNWCVTINALAAGGTQEFFAFLSKNGTIYAWGNNLMPSTVHYSATTGSCIVYMNGSTDYVTISVYQNSGGAVNLNPIDVFPMRFTGYMLRS